jgi:lipoprotein-anchoring transpeptidase ErfK/SrfK
MAHRVRPEYRQTRLTRQRRGPRFAELVLFWLCAAVLAGLFSAWVAVQVTLWHYEVRIYPNVHVLGVNLGGLTLSEASPPLVEAFGHTDTGHLILNDGQREWLIPWREAGLRLAVDTTIQNAFEVGRPHQGMRTFLKMWREPYSLGPVLFVDPIAARSVLEELAPQVALPPTDAALRVEEDRFVAEPSQPGRVLNIGAAMDRVMTAFTGLGEDNHVALPFQPAPPRIADATVAQAQAEEMLNRRLTVSAYDALTGETFAWLLGRSTIITWLRVERTQDGSSLKVVVGDEAVRATLASTAGGLGEGRGFRLEEATQRVLNALKTGGGGIQLYLTHPPRTYTVQPGDTLSNVAGRAGMVPGLITEANPGVDLNQLQVSQELSIPSRDILIPYMPVPGKRIVINIPEQRMRVYERGGLLHDWSVSTGMASSPTCTGVFQVLSKEEEAYAAQWDLRMPHFLAIYRVGGDTYNGIHALPILSSGQRLWEGALGSPASYGCIILGIREAETLYQWADIGVVVVIE